jgi:hypothetical protein
MEEIKMMDEPWMEGGEMEWMEVGVCMGNWGPPPAGFPALDLPCVASKHLRVVVSTIFTLLIV